MNASGCPLTRAWMTWATAPAIATDVASTTLPVIKYSARNTMVERKSVKSLANTSFIVIPCPGGYASGSRDHRTGEGLSCQLLTPMLRIPLGKIHRGVAGGECDRESGPQRQSRYIDHQDVGHQHQQEGQGPRPCDNIVRLQEAGQNSGFGVDHFAGILQRERLADRQRRQRDRKYAGIDRQLHGRTAQA